MGFFNEKKKESTILPPNEEVILRIADKGIWINDKKRYLGVRFEVVKCSDPEAKEVVCFFFNNHKIKLINFLSLFFSEEDIKSKEWQNKLSDLFGKEIKCSFEEPFVGANGKKWQSFNGNSFSLVIKEEPKKPTKKIGF